MNAVAWDSYGKVSGATLSARHLHDDSGQTLCGYLIPAVPRVDVVYHDDQVPEDRHECQICTGLRELAERVAA